MSNSLRLVAYLVLFFLSHVASANSYGPVKAGEMLWNIAAQINSDQRVNRYQVMLALLRTNPQAFSVSCNVNSLKVGAVLNVPSLEMIQSASAQQAINLINQQSAAWKNRRNVPIICEPTRQIQQNRNEPLESLNVIPTLKPPTIIQQQPTTPPVEIDNTPSVYEAANPVIIQQNKASTSFIKPVDQSIESSPPNEGSLDMLKEIVKNNLKLLLIIGGILIIFVLLLILMLVFVLYKVNNSKVIAQEEPHSTVFSRTYDTAPKKRQLATSGDDIKDKLEVIRTCLAEGEEAVQVLLKDVLDKGSDEQQREARQLIEINRKIHQLEQHKDPQDDLQQIANMSQYLPQTSFAPENKQQVFMLIDKIFELLDHELNANGQLIDAYTQRHQTEFFDQTVRPEKILVEKDVARTAHHSHATEKATRYL